jgi:tetratricopeptide (TPR) repeat protein
MFCPECRTEYVEGISICHDCGVQLVEELPPESTPEYVAFEQIPFVVNPDDVALIKSIFDNEKIVHFFKGEFVTHGNSVRLMVCKDQVDEALDILKNLEEIKDIKNLGDINELKSLEGGVQLTKEKKPIRIGFRILALIVGGEVLISGIISFIGSDATGTNKIPFGGLFIAGLFLYVGITGKVPLGLSWPIGKKETYDQPISDFTKAIEINPRFAETYYNRGVAYYFKKEYDKSWEDVKKAQILGYQIPTKLLEDLPKAPGRQN